MRYRLLGRTGLYVSELCLGTMTFGGQGFWKVMGGLGQDSATSLVKQAFDAGVNFIDTANVYSLGDSETLTGKAIKSLGLPRDELVVATKATGIMNETAVNARGQSRYHLMNELDASLKRLQLDHIDLYQLHGFDPLTPLEEVLSTLNDMVRSGKVRYIGLCNMAAWQIMKGLAISEKNHWARFESVQAYYTVAGRDLEREVLPLLQDQQLGLMVWSPLAGGLLSGKFAPDGKGPEGARRASFDFPLVDKARAFRVLDAMRPIAQLHQVSVAQVALAWLLSRPQVSTVIVGAKTPAQLEDNLGATQLELTPDELKALDEVSALPPEYPGWMLARQGQNRAKPPMKV
ncbi:MAG TPA: aldo/keto reductase [Polaromonas sp.]|uniref:aldo/keto reductase n=1 Tax=Polaromonas sp. UBA4122 TaxID=1947074 RepID=UPI000ED84856|nr:aldo/keto reductase [Polaromonas sp. UBA4122]HAL37476.1 aldo/keto reductase [Polaromonas sp.]